MVFLGRSLSLRRKQSDRNISAGRQEWSNSTNNIGTYEVFDGSKPPYRELYSGSARGNPIPTPAKDDVYSANNQTSEDSDNRGDDETLNIINQYMSVSPSNNNHSRAPSNNTQSGTIYITLDEIRSRNSGAPSPPAKESLKPNRTATYPDVNHNRDTKPDQPLTRSSPPQTSSLRRQLSKTLRNPFQRTASAPQVAAMSPVSSSNTPLSEKPLPEPRPSRQSSDSMPIISIPPDSDRLNVFRRKPVPGASPIEISSSPKSIPRCAKDLAKLNPIDLQASQSRMKGEKSRYNDVAESSGEATRNNQTMSSIVRSAEDGQLYVLDVQIPETDFGRYSAMFDGVLSSPKSLAGRRATLLKLRTMGSNGPVHLADLSVNSRRLSPIQVDRTPESPLVPPFSRTNSSRQHSPLSPIPMSPIDKPLPDIKHSGSSPNSAVDATDIITRSIRAATENHKNAAKKLLQLQRLRTTPLKTQAGQIHDYFFTPVSSLSSASNRDATPALTYSALSTSTATPSNLRSALITTPDNYSSVFGESSGLYTPPTLNNPRASPESKSKDRPHLTVRVADLSPLSSQPNRHSIVSPFVSSIDDRQLSPYIKTSKQPKKYSAWSPISPSPISSTFYSASPARSERATQQKLFYTPLKAKTKVFLASGKSAEIINNRNASESKGIVSDKVEIVRSVSFRRAVLNDGGISPQREVTFTTQVLKPKVVEWQAGRRSELVVIEQC